MRNHHNLINDLLQAGLETMKEVVCRHVYRVQRKLPPCASSGEVAAGPPGNTSGPDAEPWKQSALSWRSPCELLATSFEAVALPPYLNNTQDRHVIVSMMASSCAWTQHTGVRSPTCMDVERVAWQDAQIHRGASCFLLLNLRPRIVCGTPTAIYRIWRYALSKRVSSSASRYDAFCADSDGGRERAVAAGL